MTTIKYLYKGEERTALFFDETLIERFIEEIGDAFITILSEVKEEVT